MGKNNASNSAATPQHWSLTRQLFFFFLINFMAVCSITRNSHSGTQCQQVACECVLLFCATVFKKKLSSVLFCLEGGWFWVFLWSFLSFFLFCDCCLAPDGKREMGIWSLYPPYLCFKDGGLCVRVGERGKEESVFAFPASAPQNQRSFSLETSNSCTQHYVFEQVPNPHWSDHQLHFLLLPYSCSFLSWDSVKPSTVPGKSWCTSNWWDFFLFFFFNGNCRCRSQVKRERERHRNLEKNIFWSWISVCVCMCVIMVH